MSETKLLVRALKGDMTERVPFWFMRQAGRYLPEYRELRKSANGFLDLCFTPDKAAEVTLQPIRRFGMDGSILFSDILVIPHALGAEVRFAEGEGPIVEKTTSAERIEQLRVGDVAEKLEPVFETIRIVKRELPSHVTFLGFAGSPWTVACYMLAGKSGKEFLPARSFAQSQPELMQKLIEKLTLATIDYLRLQIDNGVDAVQLFDSWSGLLTPDQFDTWVIAPTQKIVAALNHSHPNTPIIGFAKGAALNLPRYAQTGVQCIGIDQHTPMRFGIESRAHARQAVQGNLDPLLLIASKEGILHQASALLRTIEQTPCVVNLGHGMQPETPIAHVEALCDMLKNYRR